MKKQRPIGWHRKVTDIDKAKKIAKGIKLLSKKQVLNLFTNTNLFEEKFIGATKSFVVYDGW